MQHSEHCALSHGYDLGSEENNCTCGAVQKQLCVCGHSRRAHDHIGCRAQYGDFVRKGQLCECSVFRAAQK